MTLQRGRSAAAAIMRDNFAGAVVNGVVVLHGDATPGSDVCPASIAGFDQEPEDRSTFHAFDPLLDVAGRSVTNLLRPDFGGAARRTGKSARSVLARVAQVLLVIS